MRLRQEDSTLPAAWVSRQSVTSWASNVLGFVAHQKRIRWIIPSQRGSGVVICALEMLRQHRAPQTEARLYCSSMEDQKPSTTLQRLIALFRSGQEAEVADFTPSDPAIEFPHPENTLLFTRLKAESTPGIPGVMGGYGTRTHPELTSILYELIADPAVRKGHAFGRPVLATPTGLVFAYAGGTHYVFLKLREDKLDAARADGGRFDPTYGTDWIEFRLGGRAGSVPDWQEAMHRWANISYRDGLAVS